MARKNDDLAEMDLGTLIDELRETKQEALNLRFRNATGQLDNTAELRKVRRQIADQHLHPPARDRGRQVSNETNDVDEDR